MSTVSTVEPKKKAKKASSPGATVLFDAPGPRARQRARIFSVIALLLVLALFAFAAKKLNDSGQFEYDKWGPLFDPSNSDFTVVWERIGTGLKNTLTAAGLAIVLSLVIGVIIGVLRISAGKYARMPLIAIIELLRGLPVILAIYLTSRIAEAAGLDLSGLPGGELLWFLVIGLTAYNSVIIAEIVRAGVASLPRGQNEAALSLGLTRGQSLRMILLPQAIRVMLPALISQLVVILKDTSLIAILGGYLELMRTSGILIQNLRNPIQMYLVTAIIFILFNYGLTKLAEYIQRRLSRTGGPQKPIAVVGAPL